MAHLKSVPAGQRKQKAEQEREALRREVEEGRQRIAELENRLKKYEAIFQGLSDGILLIDEKFADCNSQACHIWRCDQEEIIGFFPSDFAPPFQPNGNPSLDAAQQKINAAFKGNLQKFEWKDIRRDGVQIDTEVTLNRISVEGKKYVLATFRDITDRKVEEEERQALLQVMEKIIEERTRSLKEYNESLNREIATRIKAEENLERAYLELEQIFDTSGDGILVLDRNQRVVRANPAFLDLAARESAEVIGKKCHDVFPCRTNCTHTCILSEIMSGSSRTDFEKEYVTPEGERKTFLVKAAAMRDSAGKILGVVKNYKDLTEYRKWVEMLQESEEFHRITLESISDAVFLLDDEGAFVFVSNNVSYIFDCTSQEIIRKYSDIFELIGCDFFSFADLEEKREMRNIEVEIRDRRDRRHVLIINLKKAAIRSGTILVTCRDITERKVAEERAKIEYEQLVQAGKMVSLGILVSGVAHEINNPNNAIILVLPMLSRMWYDALPILDEYREQNGDFMLSNLRYSYARERVPEMFTDVMASSKRIKRIVTDLKNYARQGSTVLNEIISINSVVRAALMLLDNQLTKSTENLTVRYGERIPHFQGNFQKIEQVVINLVQNACEALRDRGRSIEVSTGHCSATDRVWVMVVDQGRGIPAEDLPHVTDPFFTTRRGRGGTGLGLSISSRIMQEHGGDIAFSSVPGQGTSVTISFPT